MCTYSMMIDVHKNKWNEDEWLKPYIGPYPPYDPNRVPVPTTIYPPMPPVPPGPTKEEFDELKREIEMLKLLIPAAKKYDADNHEPDCELEEKKDLVRRLAKLVGVEIDL